MSDEAPRALYLALLLMLVGGSLIGMRIPAAKAARMALAWVAIFGVAFILFAFRDDFSTLGQRLRSEATGAPMAVGEELRIPMSGDGHFWVTASVNGHSTRFLVDSNNPTGYAQVLEERFPQATLVELSDLPEPEETGGTFIANAELKALAAAMRSGFSHTRME